MPKFRNDVELDRLRREVAELEAAVCTRRKEAEARRLPEQLAAVVHVFGRRGWSGLFGNSCLVLPATSECAAVRAVLTHYGGLDVLEVELRTGRWPWSWRLVFYSVGPYVETYIPGSWEAALLELLPRAEEIVLRRRLAELRQWVEC